MTTKGLASDKVGPKPGAAQNVAGFAALSARKDAVFLL